MSVSIYAVSTGSGSDRVTLGARVLAGTEGARSVGKRSCRKRARSSKTQAADLTSTSRVAATDSSPGQANAVSVIPGLDSVAVISYHSKA
jgi:hypothetical protein